MMTMRPRPHRGAGFAVGSALALLVTSTAAQASDWYVRPDGGAYGAENGTDWTNAFDDFQDALGKASTGDEIWVASGIYYPQTEHGGTGEDA
ncbi:MAG: hypothetical protein JJ992_04270, partial [Planctomycetes bacterium]|nr:hypothetical protein [Planctomycetota bacterium]